MLCCTEEHCGKPSSGNSKSTDWVALSEECISMD
ncbi:hypothetical protein LEMLEM_LOCUS18216 [Lemmus lemmus]